MESREQLIKQHQEYEGEYEKLKFEIVKALAVDDIVKLYNLLPHFKGYHEEMIRIESKLKRR